MDVEVYKQYRAQHDSLVDHEMMILVYCLGQMKLSCPLMNEGGTRFYERLEQTGYKPTKEEISWGLDQLRRVIFPKAWGANYKAKMLRAQQEDKLEKFRQTIEKNGAP